MIKDIELICSLNTDRSKIAAAFLKRDLKIKGIEGIAVSSSGTLVSKQPYSRMGKWMGRQRQYQEQIIEEKGLRDLFDYNPHQTIIRPEAELILALSIWNLKRVQKIYKNAENRPEIKLLEYIAPVVVAFDSYKKMVEHIETAVSKIIKEYF